MIVDHSIEFMRELIGEAQKEPGAFGREVMATLRMQYEICRRLDETNRQLEHVCNALNSLALQLDGIR